MEDSVEFRQQLTLEFSECFCDLEKGTDASAYVNPSLPPLSFRKRDWARARLVELVEEIIQRRRNLEKEPRWQYVAE